MHLFAQILFWVAIAFMVDAAVGFWSIGYWQKRMPRVNIRRIAAWETVIAFILLTFYALLR